MNNIVTMNILITNIMIMTMRISMEKSAAAVMYMVIAITTNMKRAAVAATTIAPVILTSTLTITRRAAVAVMPIPKPIAPVILTSTLTTTKRAVGAAKPMTTLTTIMKNTLVKPANCPQA